MPLIQEKRKNTGDVRFKTLKLTTVAETIQMTKIKGMWQIGRNLLYKKKSILQNVLYK